jgi:hypothetical protein
MHRVSHLLLLPLPAVLPGTAAVLQHELGQAAAGLYCCQPVQAKK